MAQSSGYAIGGHGVDHGCGFTSNEPVRSEDVAVDAAAVRGDAGGYGGRRSDEVAEAREVVQPLAQDILDRVAGGAHYLDRVAGRDKADTENVAVYGNLPDPVHIGRTVSFGVQGGALDGLGDREVGPDSDLGGT